MKDVKKIGFLGYGKSNRALLKYLIGRLSFDAVIRDEREKLDGETYGAELFLGRHAFQPSDEDIIFLSPSVRRERDCVKALLKNGAVFSSDAELFFNEAPERVLAVTGSDGKSTTSALSGLILEKSGEKVFTAGNFGLPLTPISNERYAFFVTELSSFMLRYMKPKSKRALITNITPNHLNWHEDFEEYRAAKENVLEFSEERVFSFDCQESRELIKKYKAYAVFSVSESYKALKKKADAEIYASLEDGFFLLNGERIFERKKFKPLGIHNAKNALAALCLTQGFFNTGAVVRAFSEFSGLSHRCRLVFENDGIKYYDSSIDSSPERTRATLEVFDKPVSVILGGQDKGLDYSALEDAIRTHAGTVILCGENAKRIYAFLKEKNIPCPIAFASDYTEAAILARKAGLDTVLSPASTSYDRFSSFEERGDNFLNSVEKIYTSGF